MPKWGFNSILLKMCTIIEGIQGFPIRAYSSVT